MFVVPIAFSILDNMLSYTDSKKKRYILFTPTFWIMKNGVFSSTCKNEFFLLLHSAILLSGKHKFILEQKH